MAQLEIFDNLPLLLIGVVVLGGLRYALTLRAAPTAARKFWTETIDSLLIALVLVFFIIRPFIFQAFWIPTASMKDTLRENDRILVNKFIYHFRAPRRGEIVVFRAPPEASPDQPKDFVKRVIGLPGDLIEIKNGKLHLNGQPQEEYYLRDGKPMDYDMKIIDGKVYHVSHFPFDAWRNNVRQGARVCDQPLSWFHEATPEAVPAGQLLVLGDNRNESHDSHMWGFMPMKNLRGKALAVFWPLNRMGTLNQSVAYAEKPKPSADFPPKPFQSAPQIR
jgi:signal peptidase I